MAVWDEYRHDSNVFISSHICLNIRKKKIIDKKPSKCLYISLTPFQSLHSKVMLMLSVDSCFAKIFQCKKTDLSKAVMLYPLSKYTE